MIEFNFQLDNIDPQEFLGRNNSKLKILQSAFSQLRLTLRGDVLKVFGEKEAVENFRKKFDLLLNHYAQYDSLSEDELSLLLLDEDTDFIDRPANIDEAIVFGPNGLVVRAKTANQRKMVESSEKNDILFAVGPAGSGKTYTAVALAVRALKNREVKKIVLTRPAVEAGENLGFLPGDLKEKIDPYLRPLYDALGDMLPHAKLEQFLENGTIEIAPLAFMRGRTLDRAFVILDEAQNTTEMQLRMFLTRMGPTAKYIITGDLTQIDLPSKQRSGLVQALHLLKSIKGIDVIQLTEEDVIRHKLVKRIVKAYEVKDEEEKEIKKGLGGRSNMAV